MKREHMIGAMCTRCGYWSLYPKTFGKFDSDISTELILPGELNRELPVTLCPICRSLFVPVDPKIAGSVAELNRLGYITTSSCEGHHRETVRLMKVGNEEIFTSAAVVKFPFVLFDKLPHKRLEKIVKAVTEIQSERQDLKIKPEILFTIRSAGKQIYELPMDRLEYVRDDVIVGARIGVKIPVELKTVTSFDQLPERGKPMAEKYTAMFCEFIGLLAERLNEMR